MSKEELVLKLEEMVLIPKSNVADNKELRREWIKEVSNHLDLSAEFAFQPNIITPEQNGLNSGLTPEKIKKIFTSYENGCFFS